MRRERGITGHLRNRYYAKVDYDDLLVEAYMGNITWDEAFNRFQAKLAKETDFTNKSGVPKNKINYLYNLTESDVTVLENTSFPQEKKGKIIKEYFHSLLDIFSRYEHSKYPFEKGKILSTIATNPRLLKYLNAEEKSDLIGEQFHPKLVNFINTEPQLYPSSRRWCETDATINTIRSIRDI